MIEKLKQYARYLKSEIFVLYFAARDSRTPWYVKILVASVVVYAFSPIDLIPDFIPILGYLDDLILLPLGIALAIKLIPEVVLIDCRRLALKFINKEKPVSWVGGAIIVSIWLMLAALCSLWAYESFYAS